MRNANDDEQGVRVIFTPRAERHIETLYDYIAERAGEVRAEAYITRIVAFCLSLTTFPPRGNQRDDLLLDCARSGSSDALRLPSW
jgi:plasmid stabilization system protein ParE